MTALSLILSVITAWTPTVDSQRVQLDSVAEPPYWLGVSCLPYEVVDLTIVYDNSETILDNITGTHWKLMYISNYCPVEFYESGQYVGQIVPEPVTIFLFLPFILCRKMGRFRK